MRLVEFLGSWSSVGTICEEVNSGRRVLTDKDFLGPKEREARRLAKLKKENSDAEAEKEGEVQDFSKYFLAIEKKMNDSRRTAMKQNALKTARAERLKERDVRIVNEMLREVSKTS